MKLIYIEVTISTNNTEDDYDNWFEDVRWGEDDNSIQLPHCSSVSYIGNVITVPIDYDRLNDVIIILAYRGLGSFSGGGDDRLEIYLKKGDENTVSAAHNISKSLYTLHSDNEDIDVIGGEKENGDSKLILNYPINKTNPYEEEKQTIHSFLITEEHNISFHDNVPVRRRIIPTPCE